MLVFNNRAGYWLSNGIGIVKMITLFFVAITGLVVLGGHTNIKDPHANFKNSFDGHTTPYGMTNALVKIIFSYAGFENAFNVVNEVQVSRSWKFSRVSLSSILTFLPQNPVKRLRVYAYVSLTLVAVLYIFANIAYFAAGKEMRKTITTSKRPF